MTKQDLWDQYNKDGSNMNDLILAYDHLVKSNAYSIHKQLPRHIELDDLISDGYFGLIDAIHKFDNSYGYKFETYAAFRVRGEILDKLRVADWAPRSLRSKAKEIELAKHRLQVELERDPSVDEIATLLGWDSSEIYQVTGETSSAIVSNLDDLVSVDGSKFSLSDLIPDNSLTVGDDYLELREKLLTAIGVLSHEASTVLALYYVQDLSLREIGDLMSVTESRACQIHTNALDVLWKGCLPPL